MIHPDLRQIAAAMRVQGPDCYWFGGEQRRLPPEMVATEAAAEPALLRAMEGEMYARLYRRPGNSQDQDPVVSDLEVMRSFTAALSGANSGTGTWDPGWTFEQDRGEQGALVRRDGVIYRAQLEDCRRTANAVDDSGCRVRVPKEVRQLVRGFYMALGDADWPEALDGPGSLIRLYWNLSSHVAPRFVESTTLLLNARSLPFRAKVLQDPSTYRRADAGVLYVPAGRMEEAWPLVREIHAAVCHGLAPAVPMFTRRLADGLACAEDPGGGLSFGQSRCRLAAAGLLSAMRSGEEDAEDRTAHIARAFEEAGLDPSQPYRSLRRELRIPGSIGLDRPFRSRPRSAAADLAEPTADAEDAVRARLFERAVDLGHELCKTAVFDESKRFANWLGRQDIPDDPLLARYSVRAGALGPELYGGASGIALFLAELFGQTGERDFAAVAAAGLRRSVRILQAGTLPLHPLYFFAGHAGVLCAVHRLGALAPGEDLAAEQHWLTAAVEANQDIPASADIIAGGGGAILALLDMAGHSGDARPLAKAGLCADRLCAGARWRGEACAWPSLRAGDGKPSPPTVGLAHGTAGVALALLALYRRTGEPRYLDVARGALAFNDLYYSEAEEGWIDTRFEHKRTDSGIKGTFQSGWCHGAAGILLVRLLAAEVDSERAAVHRRYAEAAAGAVARGLEARLSVRRNDASLCHGLLGHGEALLSYARSVGDAVAEAKCRAAAGLLVNRYHTLDEWPSGVNAGGSNPSLMIGSAGVGYHLLRLAGRKPVPPILSLLQASGPV